MKPTLSQYTDTGPTCCCVSIDVERHTGTHNYPFTCLESNPIGKSFHDLLNTQANTQLNDADIMVVSQKLGRNCTIPTES